MSNVIGLGKNGVCVVAGLFVAAMAAGGCVIAPKPGDLASSPQTVAGFATQPSATIRVSAFNYTTNAYEVIGTTTAGSSPLAPAGAYCANSPALYYYQTGVTLNAADWNHSSTDPTALLQVAQVLSDGSAQVLFATSNPNGLQCVMNNVTPGCDFYNVAYNICGYRLTEIGIYTIG